ncbi:stage II sporulation protein R [Clostridium sp. D2Q-11]|uniref:Stage II sporulation protein R n=1 Tax=Anaeromonas frigoriresistens TaxID=2683708 RepID=A0A942UUH7_9FIRM|nr:stage II sporulation protein R [Anaeromonas frigoriresistens]MBS4537019.1 stage II sporulation protein R [Anaeromonas frigoriresistens]
MKGKTKIVINIILIIGILIGVAAVSLAEVYKNVDGYKEKLIRLHVIANSDTKEDQSIKLQIRDKIIEEMTPKFEKSKSIRETREVLSNNMDIIQKIAKEELHRIGKEYDVKVYFGDYDFPTKTYGGFTLPAGNYTALRVVLGEGKGENWWCVMFPPLCFLDMDNGVPSEETEKNMTEVLSEEEYNMINNNENSQDVPVKIKFKLVEVLERNRTKLAKMFDSGI